MANELVPTRQDITANMYALRAGLSVVSKEVQNGQNAMDAAAAHLDEAKNEAQFAIDRDNSVIEYWKEATRRIKSDYKLALVKAWLFALLVPVFIGVLLFVLYLWLASPSIFNLNSGEAAGIAVTVGIACIAGIIIFSKQAHYAVEDRRDFKEQYSQNVEPKSTLNEADRMYAEMGLPVLNPDKKEWVFEYKPGVNKRKVTPSYIQQKLSDAEAELANTQRICQKNIAAAETEYKNAIAAAKVNHISPAKTMYSSLAKVFSCLIDERDWANLDYLIYAVETKRADTIKEALQLLDREKQTDRIVAAIQTASREIAQLLVTGFTALSNQIASGISMLSRQIQAVSYQTSHLSARMAKISDAQTLNQALLEKANESSEQLVADAHRIAELENMRYNRGY